jgi:hypothetical protein
MLANSVIDDTVVDLTDDSNDKSALPSKRKQYEKMMHEYLKVLYTEPFKYPYREVTVGGRKYQLDCFHYADSANSSQPEFKNKRGKNTNSSTSKARML